MTNPSGFTELNPGDIIIQIGYLPKITLETMKGKHALIYVGDNKAIHSQVGKHQLGVKAIKLTDLFNATRNNRLGEAVILRPKRENLGGLIANAAGRWDSQTTLKEALLRPKDDYDNTLLPTPYKLREQDRHAKLHTLYRSFRAYLRNQRKDYHDPYAQRLLNAQPLSIKQGASCYDFVGYCYQTALILLAYPNGLPDSIQKAMKEIERVRNSLHMKKLSNIPNHYFDDLKQAVLSSEIDEGIFKELSLASKGKHIQTFIDHALNHPNEWEIPGFLCYLSTPDQSCKPHAMNLEMLHKLVATTEPNPHNFIIHEDELKPVNSHELK